MYLYKLKKQFLLTVSAGIFLVISGCISPNVRYSSLDKDEKTGSESGRGREKDGRGQKKGGKSGSRLKEIADSYIGIPYRYGGMTRRGVDCSGLVYLIYRDVYGIILPHSSRSQYKKGRPISKRYAKEGDLIFFRGGRPYRINHVGIYMGNKRFIHSSSGEGVIYSSLETDYFRRRFAGIRRID